MFRRLVTTGLLFLFYMKYTIDIAPKPTPRPRVGKFGTTYPPAYRQYKKDLNWLVKALRVPKKDYAVLHVEFGFPYAKSTPKKDRIEGKPMRVKCDLDNTEKGIMDALEKMGVLDNDAQICGKLSSKCWTNTGGYIRFSLYEL